MARPLKDGVDYFPLDTHTDSDVKFQLIEAQYGLVGYGIILKIYQMIYSNKGYYCEWNTLISTISASKWSCVDFPVTENQVSKVVRDAARYGIFDKEMLNKYGILTSIGIQKRYFGIAKRRSLKNVKSEYLLISVPQTPIIVDNNGVFAYKNPENVDNKYTKKRKEKKTVYKESKEKTHIPPTLSDIKKFVSTENLKINPEKFYFYYLNKEWQGVGNWQIKAREWNVSERQQPKSENNYAGYNIDEYENMLREKAK